MRTHALLPVSQARFSGSNERILSADGHINAGSVQEFASRMIEIATRIKQGDLVATEEAAVDPIVTKRQQMIELREAYADRSGTKWAEMAAAISYDIQQRLEREGFMRSILARGTVEEGSVPRIRIRQKNVRAIVSRGPVQVYPQYVTDGYINADEFYITANVRVEELLLRQGSNDILEDKYYEAQEQIFATEDRTVLKALRSTAGIYNPITYFAGQLTPATVQTTKYNVERWRIPINTMIASIDLFNDLATGNTYSAWFDPISKWEINQTGRVGVLFGMNVITDGYREASLQVLDQGEFMVLGMPEFLGGYTDRGPVESKAVDDFDKFVPARGWAMWEMISMAVGNAKAVALAKRNG